MSAEFISKWWLVAYAAFAVAMYAFGYAGWKVQEDAKRRGLGKAAVTFWSVSVVFFGPVFLPLYLLFRAKAVFAESKQTEKQRTPYRLCPHCGHENPVESDICSSCRKNLNPEMTLQGTKQCPYCGAMNPVEASRCSRCDQLIGPALDEDQDDKV